MRSWRQALKNGATGYVLKGSDEENLVRAVREAAAGQAVPQPAGYGARHRRLHRASQGRPARPARNADRRASARCCNWQPRARRAARSPHVSISASGRSRTIAQRDAETRAEEPVGAGPLRLAARAHSPGGMTVGRRTRRERNTRRARPTLTSPSACRFPRAVRSGRHVFQNREESCRFFRELSGWLIRPWALS